MAAKLKLHVRLISAALFAWPSAAFAQSYAGGAFMWSVQSESQPLGTGDNPSVPRQGTGGNAPGFTGSAGRMGERWGVGGEISIPARFSADQIAEKYRTHNEHRDVIASGLIHFRQRVRHSPEWVIGLSWVREDTEQQLSFRDQVSPGSGYGPFFSPTSIARSTVGLTSGVDIPIRLGSHIDLYPQVRVHWIKRADDTTTPGPRFLGLHPIVFRPALGVRVNF